MCRITGRYASLGRTVVGGADVEGAAVVGAAPATSSWTDEQAVVASATARAVAPATAANVRRCVRRLDAAATVKDMRRSSARAVPASSPCRLHSLLRALLRSYASGPTRGDWVCGTPGRPARRRRVDAAFWRRRCAVVLAD